MHDDGVILALLLGVFLVPWVLAALLLGVAWWLDDRAAGRKLTQTQ